MHGTTFDLARLVDALHASGASVQSGDVVEQPFFSPSGHFLRINGQDAQVFEYASEAAAQREAALVSPDGGTVGGSAMMWAAPPHFYRRGLLIVLYVGADPPTMSTLQSVMGPQFAGR